MAATMKGVLMTSLFFCASYSAYLNIALFLPSILPSPLLYSLHILATFYLYVQLMSYYVAACTLRPSAPLPPIPSSLLPHLPSPSSSSNDTDASICHICKTYKYARVHHCSICNACCELMDHHCPFTNQCVGLSNFRHFYIWLCWGMLAMGYALVCPYIVHMEYTMCIVQMMMRRSDV